MLFLIGTFGLNFPIFISTMAVTVFHAGADRIRPADVDDGRRIGSWRAHGGGAAGSRAFRSCFAGAAVFGIGCAVAAMMPSYVLFGIALVVIGIAAQTFTTSTNSFAQTSTEPGMRGRVISILLAIAMGGTPVGAPIVGWVADTFGPRWALGVGAASGILAAIVAAIYLATRTTEAAAENS